MRGLMYRIIILYKKIKSVWKMQIFLYLGSFIIMLGGIDIIRIYKICYVFKFSLNIFVYDNMNKIQGFYSNVKLVLLSELEYWNFQKEFIRKWRMFII